MQAQSSQSTLARRRPDRTGDPYRALRAKAWRNAMVAAINAGLEQGHFGLKPGENLWPGAGDVERERSGPGGAIYRFAFAGGVPAIAWVGDAGFDELSVHVALWPTPEAERWIVCNNADRLAGEVFATSWLERRQAPYLQEATNLFFARRDRITMVASAGVDPHRAGYRDRGRVIL